MEREEKRGDQHEMQGFSWLKTGSLSGCSGTLVCLGTSRWLLWEV